MEPQQTNQLSTSSKLVRASIVVAIVIVMNMFFNYAVSLVYKEPVYDEYVKTTQVVNTIFNKDECINSGGQWNDGAGIIDKPGTAAVMYAPYCNVNYTNDINYQTALKSYEKKVFITLLTLGIISLALGVFIGISLLAVAFTWGGVLSLIIASVRYWTVADNLAKVIILALALGLLIWLAVKKFSK